MSVLGGVQPWRVNNRPVDMRDNDINRNERLTAGTILVLLLATAMTADSREPSSPAPVDWVVYSTGSPGGDALSCANTSRREWSVSLAGETPRISPAPRSRQTRIAFANGWLDGQDLGEFGGGLWWIDTDGARTKISEENVRGLVATSFGTFALTGLDHLDLRSRKVLRVTATNPGPPITHELADLGEAPHAFTLAPDGSVIVITGTKVSRIGAPGVVEKLFSTNYQLLYPNSVALSAAGTIYVGMRHFVTRLTPVGQSYEDDWLVPADCLRFERRGFDCVCLERGR